MLGGSRKRVKSDFEPVGKFSYEHRVNRQGATECSPKHKYDLLRWRFSNDVSANPLVRSLNDVARCVSRKACATMLPDREISTFVPASLTDVEISPLSCAPPNARSGIERSP